MKNKSNIMDTLAPKPPFNPTRKNQAVKFGKPKAVHTNTAEKDITSKRRK